MVPSFSPLCWCHFSDPPWVALSNANPGVCIAKSKSKILFLLQNNVGKMLFLSLFLKLFGKYICLVSFLRVRNPFICVIGYQGPKKNWTFLGQSGQLHSLFKAAHACTGLFCPSCVVYSYTCTFIIAICGSPQKIILCIQAFWTATYTIQSCTHFILAYLDPRTKISRVPGQLNTWFKGAHTLPCLTFLLQQKKKATSFLPGPAHQKLSFCI